MHHLFHKSICVLDWVCIFGVGMKSVHPRIGSYKYVVLSLGKRPPETRLWYSGFYCTGTWGSHAVRSLIYHGFSLFIKLQCMAKELKSGAYIRLKS